MQTSELHTLKSILTEGIRIEGQEEPVEISCVYIPKIQRAYAQGRKEESDVRKDFLDALFDVLVSENDVKIELSFLFGSKQVMAKRMGSGFELLDGQQRTTTLFLLYWYISMKEMGKVPNFLSKFTYETRDTSTQFLINITSSESTIRIEESVSPSVVIKNNKWFTDDYFCDPTVCAMLNMLDDIGKQYKTRECKNIYNKLERLCFYVLMLEKFDMNDELYIKMNSRGLSLIPFENFKASLVKFMKAKERNGQYGTEQVVDGHSPYWFDFTSKIDAKWIDLFWKYDNSSTEECSVIIEIDDKHVGALYFNFINRYLFTKSSIADELTNAKLSSLTRFFYEDAETEKMHNRLFGWENYEMLFSSQDYFHKLERVFDELHQNWEFIKKEIEKDPYGNVNGFDIKGKEITVKQRVVFAAITEFIEGIPEGMDIKTAEIQDNFKRMLRVVFNIIENTTIEDAVSTVRAIKACKELISASGAITGNFYKSLATQTFISRNHQLQEEIAKAKEMFSDDEKQEFDPSWEDAFIEAENHPFFKGSILFFFTSRAGSSNNFSERYHIVKKLFDSNGITETYRKDHILIRAIISQINYWSNGLEGRYITEKSEKEKYLKILLTSYPAVRKMFCNYFDIENTGTLNEYLNNVINNATPNESETTEFKLLFKRLVNDFAASAIFDWIQGIENSKSKRFCIQNNRAYLINIPGAWYDRMVLDTERHLIIPFMVKKYSMKYEDENQKKMMDGPVKDTWGWHVRISTEITTNTEKYKLLLHFNEWKFVDFFIFSNNTDYLTKVFNISLQDKNNDCVKVSSVSYQLEKDKGIIENEINRISDILKQLVYEYKQDK